MKQIEKRIYDIELLRDITSQILDWDYGAVIGESIYSKIEKYAHIGIRIYPVESSRSEIVWNVKETEIPKDFYIEIETVLSFFNNYVIALKGKSDKK